MEEVKEKQEKISLEKEEIPHGTLWDDLTLGELEKLDLPLSEIVSIKGLTFTIPWDKLIKSMNYVAAKKGLPLQLSRDMILRDAFPKIIDFLG